MFLPLSWYTILPTCVFSDKLNRDISPEPDTNCGGRLTIWQSTIVRMMNHNKLIFRKHIATLEALLHRTGIMNLAKKLLRRGSRAHFLSSTTQWGYTLLEMRSPIAYETHRLINVFGRKSPVLDFNEDRN